MNQEPCWEKTEYKNVIRSDADTVPDHIFHLIHCSTDLHIRQGYQGPSVPQKPEKFVESFLNPDTNHQISVIKGKSGTGKSHIIQWLRLQIPQDPKTLLLTISKTSISLKKIIEMIVSELPEREQDQYREKLSSVGETYVTEGAKIDKFLNELALVIKHGEDIPKGLERIATELPALFQDPVCRKVLVDKKESKVKLIVEHVFEGLKDKERDGERRKFERSDIPYDEKELYDNASVPAQDAIDTCFNTEEKIEKSIELINLCLEDAISRTLEFSGDDLVDLMNELRKNLFKNGKRLILLIEDMSRIQGIDNALLQALSILPDQRGEKLCEMRCAFAVTDGYFDKIFDTIKTRITDTVDMDLSQPVSISKMTSGYLNALRFGEKKLIKMFETKKNGSVCTECPVQKKCFDSFGNEGEVGLFPFNETAVNIMAEKTESKFYVNDGKSPINSRFNPRIFIKKVLKNVLDEEFTNLKNGFFPSKELEERIGGGHSIDVNKRVKLRGQDPENYERRTTLLELWDGNGEIVDLKTGIHESFRIPPLRSKSSDPTPPPTPKPVTPPGPGPVLPPTTDPTPPKSNKYTRIIEDLEKWGGDKQKLTQQTAQDLRSVIYDSIYNFVDWDFLLYEFLIPKPDEKGDKLGDFRHTSIDFIEQQGKGLTAPVKLEIKQTENNAVALQSLVHKKYTGGWDFEGSATGFPVFLEALKDWSSSVIKQLKEKHDPDTTFAIVEMMALTILVSGEIGISEKKNKEEIVDETILKIWNSDAPTFKTQISKDYHKHLEKITVHWKDLQYRINSLFSGTKGTSKDSDFKNPTQIRDCLGKFLPDLNFQRNPSNDTVKIADIYSKLKQEFTQKLQNEKSKYEEWDNELIDSLGKEKRIKKLFDSLKILYKLVSEQDLDTKNDEARVFLEDLDEKPTELFQESIDHLEHLRKENSMNSIIRIASIATFREEIDGIIKLNEKVLNDVEANVETRKDELGRTTSGAQKASKDKIGESIEKIIQTLTKAEQLKKY